MDAAIAQLAIGPPRNDVIDRFLQSFHPDFVTSQSVSQPHGGLPVTALSPNSDQVLMSLLQAFAGHM